MDRGMCLSLEEQLWLSRMPLFIAEWVELKSMSQTDH